jgi:hypothetical protein
MVFEELVREGGHSGLQMTALALAGRLVAERLLVA